MRIAIIPARGGSKRVPDKNILPFFGRPMLHHSIQAARDSGLFDVIHVSTDSAAIAAVAAVAGCPPDFPRPEHLADDSTPVMPVVQYVLSEYQRRGKSFEAVSVIYPCAPLIEGNDLREAWDIFMRTEPRRPLMAVGAFPVPIEWAYLRSEDGTLTPVQPGAYAIRSQDLTPKYYDSGTFYFYTSSHILGPVPVADTGYVSYLLPRTKAVDIDDYEDLKVASALYEVVHGRRVE